MSTRVVAVNVDIDGTLALRQEDQRGTFEFHKAYTDLPNVPIVDLVKLLSNYYVILITSGREEKYRTVTERWLAKNQVPYFNLFMRATGDNRKDFLIKQEIYERDISPLFDVKWWLDDRNQVVDHMRTFGLTVLQVAPGAF